MKKTKLHDELPEELEDDALEENEEKKAEATVDSLIEKGKKGKLSQRDLDDMMEEMDFDIDQIDKLYETLEDNGINFEGDLSDEEMSAIENEVAQFGAAESMENVLEQEGRPERESDAEGKSVDLRGRRTVRTKAASLPDTTATALTSSSTLICSPSFK